MLRGILMASLVLAALAASAQAETMLYDEAFAPGFRINAWDGAAVMTDKAHSGTNSLANHGHYAVVRVDGGGVPAAERPLLEGNTIVTMWVLQSLANGVNSINFRMLDPSWSYVNSSGVTITGSRSVEMKPSTYVIEYSTDGTTYNTMTSFNELGVNTWTKVKVDFAQYFDAAHGFALTENSRFDFVDVKNGNQAGTDHWVYIDEIAWSGGTVVPPTNHPGDYNGDSSVTDADYTVWADNYGLHAGTATFLQGDGNDDKNVTDADYTIWADNYGTVYTGNVVPEPATMSLLGMGLLGLIRRK